MNIQEVIQSQYLASLAMMKRVIEMCPAALWDDHTAQNRYWQVAYHGLYYVHLYLSPTQVDFVPWQKHEAHYETMGQLDDKEPCSQADMLEYVTLVEQEVKDKVPTTDWEAPSGFAWYYFNKLELQFCSMRHIQLHVGELAERLWDKAGVEVKWVGKGD